MSYVIVQKSSLTEDKYIAHSKTGNYYSTDNKSAAIKFTNTKDACTALSRLPMALTKGNACWRVEEFETTEQKERVDVTDIDIDSIDNLTDISQNLIDSVYIIEKMIDNEAVYHGLLSKYDRSISDILHLLEDESIKINASQGYKYLMMIRNYRVKRRKVKNVIAFLKSIKNTHIDSLIHIKNGLDEMRNRIYTPKVLTDLFTTS